MEENIGRKAIAIASPCHNFEDGTEIVHIGYNWFVGLSKNTGYAIQQLLEENEFKWIDEGDKDS